MLQRTDEVSAPLAAFERAASGFECGILAARDAAIAENSSLESGSIGTLLDIGGTARLLKGEGRDAIGLLATSDRAEQPVMADACRARMAGAINLHRLACRCIKQGIVPPLPALDAGALETGARQGADSGCHSDLAHGLDSGVDAGLVFAVDV